MKPPHHRWPGTGPVGQPAGGACPASLATTSEALELLWNALRATADAPSAPSQPLSDAPECPARRQQPTCISDLVNC